MWPYGYSTPPCAGGKLTVKNKDGSFSNTFSSNSEDLIKGDFDMTAMQAIDIQKALNVAKQRGRDGKVLAEDDIYGPNTAFALANGFRVIVSAGEPLAEMAHDRLNNLANI
jgi:hypothetical protein